MVIYENPEEAKLFARSDKYRTYSSTYLLGGRKLSPSKQASPTVTSTSDEKRAEKHRHGRKLLIEIHLLCQRTPLYKLAYSISQNTESDSSFIPRPCPRRPSEERFIGIGCEV